MPLGDAWPCGSGCERTIARSGRRTPSHSVLCQWRPWDGALRGGWSSGAVGLRCEGEVAQGADGWPLGLIALHGVNTPAPPCGVRRRRKNVSRPSSVAV